MILTKNYSRVILASGLEMRYALKASWWVSSRGEIFESGDDHREFVDKHPEKFGFYEDDPRKAGFAKVGYLGGAFYIDTFNLVGRAKLGAIQKIYMSLETDSDVHIFLVSPHMDFMVSKIDFISANNQDDLIKKRNRF